MMQPMARRRSQPTDRRRVRQATTAFVGMLLGLTMFVIVERVVVPRYSFATPADHAIPFIPLTWAIYMLFFPFVIALSAFAQKDAFETFKSAVATAFILSFGCFLLFPEVVPRPDQATITNAFLRQRLTRLWMMDLASNGLPSLHVSVTWLACRMAWLTRFRLLAVGTGLLICISTLTLKQHTLADVAGGVLMAILCSTLAERRQSQGVIHGDE